MIWWVSGSNTSLALALCVRPKHLTCVQFLNISVYLQLHCPFLGSKIQGASGMAILQGTFICGSLAVYAPVRRHRLLLLAAAVCGVSVTSFQGLQRQILLDMLWCMGVDVQKEMRLNAVSHIIARDVDDKCSKKLEHARK